MISYQKALINDIDEILSLIEESIANELILPLSYEQITETIRDFFVAIDDKEKICGVVSLHIYTDDLAEVRTLVVKKNIQNNGIGKQLINECIKNAKVLGIKQVFALTKVLNFFQSLGFVQVEKDSLPEKVYKDCIYCSKLHNCDEIPVLIKIS